MAGGKGKLTPSDNPKPFTKDYQPANKGPKPSFKTELIRLLELDGEMIIPAKNILKINEDGSVKIKVLKKEALATKLLMMAMSGNGSVTLNALKEIMDRIDGKAKQTIEVENSSSIIQINTTEENKNAIENL